MTDDIDKKIKDLASLKLEEVEKKLKKESDDKKKREHAEKQKEKVFSEAYTFFKRIISKLEIEETDILEIKNYSIDGYGDRERRKVKGYRIVNKLKYISYLHLTKTELVFVFGKAEGVGDVILNNQYQFSVDEDNKFIFFCDTQSKKVNRELTNQKQKSLEERLEIAQETFDRRLRSYKDAKERSLSSNTQYPSSTRVDQLRNDLYKYYNDIKYFDSKNEFIDHAFSKLTDSMTDEEVMKYFKKL